MRRALIATLSLLMACQPQAGDQSDPLGDAPTPEQIAQCYEDQGEIVPGGHLPWACQLPHMDGGKPCSDGADCEGLCLAEGGVCSVVSPIFGCYPILEDGQEVTICVD